MSLKDPLDSADDVVEGTDGAANKAAESTSPRPRRRRTRAIRAPENQPPEASASAAVPDMADRERPPRADQPASVSAIEGTKLLTLGDLALVTLRREFAALAIRGVPVRRNDEPESVHQMRVALRRLRAALTAFRIAVPDGAQAFRRELNWLAGELGQVRDHDVLLEGLRALSAREGTAQIGNGLQDAIATAELQREARRAGLSAALESRRYADLMDGFGELLDRGVPLDAPAAGATALEVLPDLLRKRLRRLSAAAARARRRAPSAAYHRVRLRAKRLRYALEFCGEVYGKAVEPVVRNTKALQDLLGELQDTEVALDFLHEQRWADGKREGHDDPSLTQAVSLLRKRSRSLRSAFPRALRNATGKQWKRLKVVLEARRARAKSKADLNVKGDSAVVFDA